MRYEQHKKKIFVGKKRALTWIWMLFFISTFVIANFLFVTHFYDKAFSSCSWCCCGPLLLFHKKWRLSLHVIVFFVAKWNTREITFGWTETRMYRRQSVQRPIDKPYIFFVSLVSVVLWHFCLHRQYLPWFVLFSLYIPTHSTCCRTAVCLWRCACSKSKIILS